MNFLAHAWLARGGSDEFLWGNLIADGVKGSDLSAWPTAVAEGIRHHRRVDAFVDAHDVVAEIRRRAPSRQRRYAGIALDLVWDHFVACELGLQAQRSPLIARTYRLLKAQPAPARLATLMPALVEQDWLHRYVDFGFTCRAIAGIGQRLAGHNHLAELVPWLEKERPRLADDFLRLWPEVRQALEVRESHGEAR